MKYLLTATVGLAAGAVLACAALYFNPLTAAQSPEPGAEDRRLQYEYPSQSSLLTHGGRLRLPVAPAGVERLWENTIRRSLLHVVELTDADGPAAVATRISLPSRQTDLLRRGMIIRDRWLVTVPGEGSFMLEADTNLWPLLRDHVVPVWYLGRAWAGPASYQPTVGPGRRDAARADGLTGRFEGTEGSAVERFRLESFSRHAGPEKLVGELHLRWIEPPLE